MTIKCTSWVDNERLLLQRN